MGSVRVLHIAKRCATGSALAPSYLMDNLFYPKQPLYNILLHKIIAALLNKGLKNQVLKINMN